MNYSMHKNTNGGYIALMATIVISLVLLVMVVRAGFVGWSTRFMVLGTEAKEQANALAEGCADQALASLVTDTSYLGGSTSVTPAGTCSTSAIDPLDLASGVVTIRTQAIVNNAYANLQVVQNLNNIHLGSIPSLPTYGTLIVQTLVTNPASGAQKTPADFAMNVASVVGTSPASFAGSATGVIVHIPATATTPYSVTETAVAGYAPSLTTDCAGTIRGGDIKSCTVTNAPVTTTLTLLANVNNNDGTGSAQPADILMYIDGVATPATLGHAYALAAGAHTVTATNPNTTIYSASSWGYQCSGAIGAGTVSLNLGDNKICVVNLDDNPPPAPICADTVMMLDRSFSMFGNSAWIPDEKAAAKALVDLYASVTTSHPFLGMGRFGDVATGKSAEIVSQLSSGYAALKTAIDNALPQNPISFTNLADAITKGGGELSGPNHQAGKEKVLILISDGDPNEPTGGTTVPTGFFSPTGNAQDSNGEFWSNPQNAYADGGGDASDPVSEDDQHRFFSFNLPTIPASATVQGIEAKVDAWATTTGMVAGPVVSATRSPNAGTITSQWQNPTRVALSDDSYVTDSTQGHVQGFGTFGFAIPASATITGVQVTTEAKVSGSGSSQTTPALYPNSGGTYSSWSGNSGDVNETNNFNCSSFDSIITSTNNARSSFALSLASIPDGSTINSVIVTSYDRSDSFGSGTYKVFARLGGTNVDGTTSFTTSSPGGSNSCTTRAGQLLVVSPTIKNSGTVLEIGALKVSGSAVRVGAINAVINYTAPASGSVAVSLTSNNGSNWTAAKNTALDSAESVDMPSGNGTSDMWSRTWVPSDFADGKFAVRVQNNSNTGVTVSLDQIVVNVFYTVPVPGPAACQLGMDLSWNGGSSWTSAKTQTLIANEASYTLGSPSDDWGSHTWVPGDFANGSNKFVARVHAIDPGANCDNASIEHLDWLQLQVTYSVPTSPSEAALLASDAAKISGTDIFTIYFGSGNPGLLAQLASGSTPNGTHQAGASDNLSHSPTSGNTGYASPTTNVKDSGGDANGFEVNPQNAYANDSSFAQNVNGADDRHRYGGYHFSLPANVTVSGIVVRPDWWSDSTSGTNSMSVELSWDGGTSWTAAKSQGSESTSDSNNKTVGASNDLWGHAWSQGDLDPSKFLVRVTSLCSGSGSCSSRDFYLDWLGVDVYYTGAVPENGDGDNFFVAPTSADMKGIFEFIGNQVCPAINNVGAATAPTTASLLVLTRVVNNYSGANASGDFGVSITGTNVSPATFAGVDSPGKQVALDPGSYSAAQTGVPAGYTQSQTASCSSAASTPIEAGESRVCVITNSDIPPPPPPPNLTVTPGSWQEIPKTTP